MDQVIARFESWLQPETGVVKAIMKCKGPVNPG